MTFLDMALLALVGPFILYLAARVVSAAIFRSKQDYERNTRGTQNQPRP